ncbi:hypothetical protein V8F20_010094 [Naviculisporaceae sp. PSN 640]
MKCLCHSPLCRGLIFLVAWVLACCKTSRPERQGITVEGRIGRAIENCEELYSALGNPTLHFVVPSFFAKPHHSMKSGTHQR